MTWTIPELLVETCARSEQGRTWLGRLPAVISELRDRWALEVHAPFVNEEGSCSWVAPVTVASATSAVLKIGWPHMEAQDEIAGLRAWAGDSMVRLLNADESVNAMLIERCVPGTMLRALAEHEQDVVLTHLLRTLWRPAPETFEFRPLSVMTAFWVGRTRADAQRWPDHGLINHGLRVFEELPQSSPTEMLLLTDLHAGNVLRAERAPWLAIDPKPFVGDPAYDATQHLINCPERLQAHPLDLIHRVADLLEVPRERVRLWMFARAAAQPRLDWHEGPWMAVARAIAP